MDIKYTIKKQAITTSISILLLIFFVLGTDPRVISAGLLLFMPLLVYATFFYSSKFLSTLLLDLSAPKQRVLCAVLAGAPTLMVVLGSLGQLGFQDILLALMLCFGFVWYLKRMQPYPPK